MLWPVYSGQDIPEEMEPEQLEAAWRPHKSRRWEPFTLALGAKKLKYGLS